MEFGVKLLSSWNNNASSKISLENILYIKKNSGIIIDQPLQHNEDSPPIELHRPLSSPSETCYIFIDVTKLRGYFVTGLELISSSRTVEFYNGRRPNEEYMCTNRGTLVEQHGDSGSIKLYKCVIDSSSLDITIKPDLSLKLVSLHSCERAYITQISLIVTENMGGGEKEGEKREAEFDGLNITPTDLQQLINDRCSAGSSTNEDRLPPPLLPKLLATLQQLQQAQTTTRTEMDEMVSFFRQMRPNFSTKQTEKKEEKEESDSLTVDSVVAEVVTDKEDTCFTNNDMRETELDYLEKRLKEYIDTKIATLQDTMETKFKEMYEELWTAINNTKHNESLK